MAGGGGLVDQRLLWRSEGQQPLTRVVLGRQIGRTGSDVKFTAVSQYLTWTSF